MCLLQFGPCPLLVCQQVHHAEVLWLCGLQAKPLPQNGPDLHMRQQPCCSDATRAAAIVSLLTAWAMLCSVKPLTDRSHLCALHMQAAPSHAAVQASMTPYLAPPENVAVGHIERPVLAGLLGAAPLHRLCQQLHINHLQQGVVGLWRPREPAGSFSLFAAHASGMWGPCRSLLQQLTFSCAEQVGVQSIGKGETVLRQMLDHHLQEGAAQPRIRMQYLKGKPWALQMLAYTASVIVKFMTCSSIGKGWTH